MNGALQIFPDIVVQQADLDEWIGVSRQPAETGETLVLDVLQFDAVEGEIRRRVPVCVIESRPIIVDGSVRHRIRLAMVQNGAAAAVDGGVAAEAL